MNRSAFILGERMEFTEADIVATRQDYVESTMRCKKECLAGVGWYEGWDDLRVEKYIEFCNVQITDAMAGKYDHTLTFLQRMVYIKTGKSVPILSK